MDELTPITIGANLKDIIFDQYPVSFIIIILSGIGYYMGHKIFSKQKEYLEKTVSDLIMEIIKSL